MLVEYEKVMAILENECMNEMLSAKRTEELMKKSLFPFKRIKLKRSYDNSIYRINGIKQLIYQIIEMKLES